MNLLFFQHGDYGEAYRRFKEDGSETYRDQKVSVDFVASLTSNYTVTTVAACGREHDESLGERLRSVGITTNEAYRRGPIHDVLNSFNPQAIICRSPNFHIASWARSHNVPTLLVFADFFSNDTLRKIAKNAAFRSLITSHIFPCIANHSLNASLSTSTALFYPKQRIVPWDLRRLEVCPDIKKRRLDQKLSTAFFAGAMVEDKGVGDCIEAVAILKNRNIDVTFEFAGPGDTTRWEMYAEEAGVRKQIKFDGILSNDLVRSKMRDSDVIVVPSRHSYAEGLPNTIYEGLASRTPLIVSDHPAYAGRLANADNCLIFPAGKPISLAEQIATLFSDIDLYKRLSDNAASAHHSLYFGIEWTQLITLFLNDPINESGWVIRNSLDRLARQNNSADKTS